MGGAIRAGRAFVELFADDSRLLRALDSATGRVKKFAGNVISAGLKTGAAGAAITAPLTKAVVDAASRGRDIDQLAKRFDLTTESVSELAYAFESVRVPFEEFDGVMTGLAGKISAAADSNTELVEGLRNLNGRALIMRPLDETFALLADHIKNIDSPLDMATRAEQLFGSAGLKLLPILKQGADGIRKLKAEAKAGGWSVSAAEAKQSTEVMKAANVVWQEAALTIRDVGMALLPTADATGDYTKAVRSAFGQVRDWIADHKDMIVLLAKLGGGLVATSVILLALLPILKGAAFALGLVASGVKLVGLAFVALLTPLGFVAYAFAGLAALWLTTTDRGKTAASELGKAFSGIAGTFGEMLGALGAAIGKGDLELAFQIAAAGIKAIWYDMIVAMTQAFAAFIHDNRDAIVALGAIFGAWKGGMAGARFGPWGAIVGGGGGAALGGIGADKLAELLEGIGHNPAMEAAAAAAHADLRKLGARAAAPAPGRAAAGGGGWFGKLFDMGKGEAESDDNAHARFLREQAKKNVLPPLFSSVKGLFAGPSQQMLGYADQTAKRQIDAIGKVEDAVGETTDAVNKLTGALLAAISFA